ncbi:MAG: magnesium-translocating P-type ATPase [Candidatus Doudnabacteria bacterium]|jgi:Mg2+-importing ATPase
MPIRLHGLFKKKHLFLNLPQDLSFDPGHLEVTDLFIKLGSGQSGLSGKEAKKRLFKYGYNQPAKKVKKKLLHEILMEFANPLVVLLLIIGLFSFFFSDRFSAIIIFVMATMSALLSFYQEHKAEKAVEKLNAMVRVTASVMREGSIKELNTRDIVPGDVISLSAGDIVSADMRLISANDLFLSESSLTGESLPVEKTARTASALGLGVKSPNLVFMGSSVVSGTALGLVFHTGQHTEFGKVAGSLEVVSVETSFNKGIKSFTWLMIWAILSMVVIILLINFLDKNNFFESLIFALAVAVGLAPETLPMIVTINLSKGALLMSRRKVVVKKLDSIQSFGAMDVLCTDKTGTLTLDKVVLEKHTDVFGQESEEVFEFGFINSFYQTGLKNLLDKAVLAHDKPHLQSMEKIDEIPFDFSRKIMSVVVKESNGGHILVSKGAPEEIIKRSGFYENHGQAVPLDGKILEQIQNQYSSLSREGFRVLALASRHFSRPQTEYGREDETGLVIKGFMAFLDPAKPDAKATVDALEKVGVRIVIITGDNELVTRKICGDIGLSTTEMLTGEQVEKMPETELLIAVEKTNIFSRMLPLQKQRIIQALQKCGHTVGYMGDGINDAPALKVADVGISVNNAAEVARESASIILLEKNLAVLSDGVLEGRKVFGNIIKYIRMSSSSNFGNMLSMTGASLFLPFLPMLPTQILLNNFLYDLSQIGIPTDEVDKEYLDKPKPWRIDLIKKYMVTVGPVSSLFDFLTFGMMWWVFDGYIHQNLFRTGWFIESLVSQTIVVYVIRTKKIPFIQSRPSKLLVLTTLLVLFAGIVMPYTKLAEFFGLVRPPGLYFLLLAGLMLAYLFLVQIVKNWFIRKFEHD